MSGVSSCSPRENAAEATGGASRALDADLTLVRESGLRVMRLVGAALGLASMAVLGAQAAGIEPGGGPGPTAILTLGAAFGIASCVLPLRMHRLVSGTLIAVVSLMAVVGLWFIGPSLPVGALLVTAPLLASFFFGRRMAMPGAAAVALVLAAVGVGSRLAGRESVGAVPGARIPYAIYLELALFTLGNVVIALAAVRAALGAMERSLRGAHEAAERERAEHDRLSAAERALAQAKRLEAIGHLAGGVAHDTRNALLVLSAGLHDLRASARSAQDREVLSDLEHAVANVTHTMQQLLSLGRRQPSAARLVTLSAVVVPLVSALRRVIPPEVEVRLEGGAGVQVHLDPARLEQALLNLALNARDAMPAGGVLTVRLEQRAGADGDLAVVGVEDTGNGMDPPTAARMFEPFFTTKPVGAGTGLGLALVQEFVAEAGGRIEVESALGRGTRVRLVFPAGASAESSAVA
jgi:signal transduction histidine kinase